MAKGNDGNYLQHSIEVEVASHLSLADPLGRLHIALTHGMAPFEPFDSKNNNNEKRILYDALDKAKKNLQSDEPKIVTAYRKVRASPSRYPNTAIILKHIVGVERLSGGITETDLVKHAKIVKAVSGSSLYVKNSSWRKQLEPGRVLCCPSDLRIPWLLSMDPMKYKIAMKIDDDNLYYEDLEILKIALSKYFNSRNPGVACFFTYDMSISESGSQKGFWGFIEELADILGFEKKFYWIHHDKKKERYNLAGVISSDKKFIPFGQNLQKGRLYGASKNKSLKKLKLRKNSNKGMGMNSNNNSILDTDSEKLQNDQRRIGRMNYWIQNAQSYSTAKDKFYVKFLFYWIAYEAAYKKQEWENFTDEFKLRKDFHENIQQCKFAKKEFPPALMKVKDEVQNLIMLRQASRHFWYKKDGWDENPEKWERKFNKEVKVDCDHFKIAAHDGRELAKVFDSVFANLSIVRHQIIHGGSSGEAGYGGDQVEWGAKILESIIPLFRDFIVKNNSVDWGKPPFPRVGTGPNDPCPPPWFK